MPTSIKDVARVAGVSAMTVSNVINERPGVSERTRHLVQQAIASTGYTRNASARQLRLGHSQSVAVAVHDALNPFYADLARGADTSIDRAGATTTVMNAGDDTARAQRMFELAVQQRPLGMVLAMATHWEVALLHAEQLEAADIATTAICTAEAWPTGCTVCGDDRLGGELVGVHFAERGHRSVAFIGLPGASASKARRTGLSDGLSACVPLDEVVVHDIETTDNSIEAGRAAGRALLRIDPRPTAVFCVNDLVALGLLQVAIDEGLSIPNDLAIVGYDDIPFAAGAAIPLSSVHQSAAAMGRRAADLVLVARHEGDKHVHKHEVFAPELMVRRSSDVWH